MPVGIFVATVLRAYCACFICAGGSFGVNVVANYFYPQNDG
jgi:hypothetical protein